MASHDVPERRTHAIVIPPCHFENPSTLCGTTLARIRIALAIGRSLDPADTWWVPLGGAVPYERGSETLGVLIGRELLSRGIPLERILVPTEGAGTFAEARHAVNLIDRKLPGRRTIHVVSSDWWLWSGERIWRHFAWFVDRLLFIPVLGTGGRKTRRSYAVYSRIILLAYWLGCEGELENFLTKRQAGRVNGFKLNGCA